MKSGRFDKQLDYNKIGELRRMGRTYSEISHIMNCSATAISYALKALRMK